MRECRQILSTLNVQLLTDLRGLVIKNTGSWYLVKTDEGTYVECKIKGNFRLKGIRSTNPVAVGDYVQIILNQEGTAFINEIEDRKNYIIRRSSNLSKQSHILAANLDQCMLVVTVNYPETSTTFIDRFLASAEAYRVPVNIIFNKTDATTKMSFAIWTAYPPLYHHRLPLLQGICQNRRRRRHDKGRTQRKNNPLLRTLRSRKIHPHQHHSAGAGHQNRQNLRLPQ